MTHSSPTLTDEVGVRGLDGEIIHSLRLLNQPQSFHHAIAAISRPHPVAELQLPRRHPATIDAQEGMLWGGFDDLAVEGEGDEDLVRLRSDGGDGIPADTC